MRHRLSVPDDSPLVVQIGNFKPQKGPLEFVRVAAAVALRLPNCRFVMTGDGPLRSEAESLARSLGVLDKISMPGWVEDVPALLDAANVVVLTSWHEGLPRSVVEAVAAGKPVVATAVDGTVEVVRDGVNGFLCPPGDIECLAGKILSILEDPNLAARLASGAKETDITEFDINLMVRKQEELYRCIHPYTS